MKLNEISKFLQFLVLQGYGECEIGITASMGSPDCRSISGVMHPLTDIIIPVLDESACVGLVYTFDQEVQ